MGIGARNPRYEVVFFDLYGTLIDIRTDEQSEAAWQALYDCVTELGAQYESCLLYTCPSPRDTR